jgi:RimJ/RimL family protein N-acetyltransferase
VNVRLITPADESAYHGILARTSDEDRYYRFFRAVDVADCDTAVRPFVEARADMIGFIAESDGVPLGAAHAALIDAESAEVAILVARDGRERKVGTSLLSALITYLRERNYSRIVAHSLQENVAFARLAQRVGMQIEHSAGSNVLWSITFPRTAARAAESRFVA